MSYRLKNSIIYFFIVIFSIGCSDNVKDPAPYGPVPTERQLEWHKMKYYAFIVFGPSTFTDMEWGYGDESPEIFNPTELDVRQWARVVKEAGMEGIMVTAKHHDGFCLWPSKYTDHTVASSPWKKGKGDILKELREACDEYGLKLGMYLSPWDRNHPDYGTPKYVDFFQNQLKELLTNYGEIFEVYFDGANGGDGYYGGANEVRRIDNKVYYDWDNTWKIVRDLQPNAVIFGDGGPDLRWIGNEQGYAQDPNWSIMDSKTFYPGGPVTHETLQTGDEDGDLWVPSEVNTSIRPGWLFHESENNKVKSVNQLIKNWYYSVGMNGGFILNLPPDKRGLIHDNDIKSVQGLKKYFDEAFSVDYSDNAEVSTSNVRGNVSKFNADHAFDDDLESYWATDDTINNAFVEVDFGKTTEINALLLQEYIRLGQRIERFTVEALQDNKYTEVAKGITIGNRRLIKFKTIKTSKIKIKFNGKASLVISNIEVYRVPEMIAKPIINRNKEGIVEISSESPDPIYRYTINGSIPDEASTLYKKPFSFNQVGIIKVKAFLESEKIASDVVSKKLDVPKAKWTASSSQKSHSYYPISNAIDGNPNTTWFTEKKTDNKASTITIDFGERLNLKGFSYLPRQDGRSETNIFKYTVEVSQNGNHWNVVLKGKEFSNIVNNPIIQEIMFPNTVQAKHMRLTCINDVYSEGRMNVAELDVITQ